MSPNPQHPLDPSTGPEIRRRMYEQAANVRCWRQSRKHALVWCRYCGRGTNRPGGPDRCFPCDQRILQDRKGA